jgi:hypothetical protein
MNYELEKRYHTSYCGSYCHHCVWHTGAIRKAYSIALRMFDEYGLRRLIEGTDVAQFRKALESLSLSSICPGCKIDALHQKPEEDRCEIRQCCLRRGFNLCCECSEFPCAVLEKHPGVTKFKCIENLVSIKEKGAESWINREWSQYCD